MGESKTSPRRLGAKQRQREALELRKAGKTFEVIADTLGYSDRAAAYNAVMTALKDAVREPADELRVLEDHRLDSLNDGLWEAALRGDPKAVEQVLKIAQRRARLLGLDAPIRTAVEHTGSLEQRIREYRERGIKPTD